ncbi:hypothetical protein D2T29_12745 [Sinirhodobacter populi]|uniref:Uncharacterized protein n=1 Tax=Paenirhodobacter populi TaxID=2306993 RepID=A0A443KD59_9RHOB|nr:hypothetical protein [Sinirhodobacter populi]RWR30533.1 hypothetical protein D2T29_12745 [Sinirhodobacter populi]
MGVKITTAAHLHGDTLEDKLADLRFGHRVINRIPLARDAYLLPEGGKYGGQVIADFARWADGTGLSAVDASEEIRTENGVYALVIRTPSFYALVDSDKIEIKAICITLKDLARAITSMDQERVDYENRVLAQK